MGTTGVKVTLHRWNGDVASIIGRVSKALRKAGFAAEAKTYSEAAFACDSFDAVMGLTKRTVDVG